MYRFGGSWPSPFTRYWWRLRDVSSNSEDVSKHQTRPQSRPITISAWRYIVAGGITLQGHLWYLATILGISAGRTPTLCAGMVKPDGLFLAWDELTRRKIHPVRSALGGLMIGLVLVGPGATLATAWFFRGQLSGTPEVRKKRAWKICGAMRVSLFMAGLLGCVPPISSDQHGMQMRLFPSTFPGVLKRVRGVVWAD